MSVGGGGRSFPVYIDLILRGVPQVQQQLQQVVNSTKALGTTASQTTKPIVGLERGLTTTSASMTTTGRQTTLLDANFKTMGRSVSATGPLFSMAANSMANTGTQTTLLTRNIQGAGTQTTLLASKFKAMTPVVSATGPLFSNAANSMANTGRQTTLLDNNLTNLNTSTRTTGAAFQSFGGQMQMLGGTVRSTTSSYSPLVSAISQAGAQANTTTGSMNRHSAVITTLKENIRGMIFPIGGMIGALNEAAFMSGRVEDSEQNLSEAQAELNRLAAEGAQGTQEYARAQAAVDKAQRALNFTNRIMVQSWFDVVFFVGSLLGSMTGLIGRYKELSQATVQSSGALNLFSARGKGLKGVLSSVFTSIANTVGGLGGLTGGFIKSAVGAKVAQSSLGQANQTMGLGTRAAGGFKNALTGIASALGLGGGAATAATGALGGLEKAMSKTSSRTTGAKGSLDALRTSGLDSTVAMKGLSGALLLASASAAVVGGSILAAGAILVVFKDQFTALSESMVQGTINMGLAGEDLKKQQEGVRKAMDDFFATIFAGVPGMDQYVKKNQETAAASGEAAPKIVGVADATKEFGVAVDGTLQPLSDLAKYNLDAGATAGELLMKVGLLGAGMTNLSTGMAVTGDVAVRAATAYLQLGQDAAKAAQEDFNLVASQTSVAAAMNLTGDQIATLANWYRENTNAEEELKDEAKELTTEQQRQIDSTKAITEAMNGLNAQSISMMETNNAIVKGVGLQTQAFNENAVKLAAQASGIQTWRDSLAQSYHDIVENATALGFMGDATKANVVEMLRFTGVQTKMNEGNEASVETWFQLDDKMKATLGTFGLTDKVMGEVALGTRDLSAEQVNAIDSVGELDQANKDAVKAYNDLSTEIRAALAELGVTPEVMGQVEDGTYQLTDAELNLLNTQVQVAETVDKMNEAISELHPSIQKLAEQYGLAGQEAEKFSTVQEAVFGRMQDLDGQFKDTVKSAVEFVDKQGQLGEVTGMSEIELANFVATMEISNETMKSAAEIAQEESQALADSWEAGLERAVEAWETSSSAFATAAENISDEIGDAGAEGAIKFTEGFLTEFVPQQVIEEAFDENIDVEDLIGDIKKKAEDALEDGLISPIAMSQAIQPMIDEMEKIPGKTEYSMGEMIAVARNAMTNLKPVIVGGIHEVGADAVKAFNTGVFQPLQTALEAGGGTGVWGGLITNFQNVVNQLPPEYDRMKGDFNKTLSMLQGDTRAQINAILPILREINPEWAKIVEQMDTDGDGIKDMFDNKITSPAEAMRDSIVDAFIMVFDALGKVNPEFAKAAQHLRDLKAAGDGTSTALQGINLSTGQAIDGLGQLDLEMTGLNETQQDAAIKAYELANNIDVVGRGFDAAQIPVERVRQGFIDINGTGLVTSSTLGGVGDNATTAAGNLDTLQGSAFGTLTDFNTLNDSAIDAGTGLGTAGMAAGTAGTQIADLNTTMDTTTRMTIAWVGHFTAVSNAMSTILFPALLELAGGYVALRDGIHSSLETSNQNWSAHVTHVGGQIGVVVESMVGLASEYMALKAGIAGVLSATTQAWGSHSGAVSSIANNIVSNPMSHLARAYVDLRNGVRQVLRDGSNQWNGHASTVRQAANSAGNSVNQLRAHVVSNMNTIVSAMNRARAAANALKSSINALRSKTITVRTNYVTSGRKPGAARGFGPSVVNRPTDIHVGEGGRPELVSVTPLQGTPAARMGGKAALRPGGGIGIGSTASTGRVFRAAQGLPQSSGSRSGIRGNRAASQQQPTVIDNRIIIDGIEMKRWIRKTSNEGYSAMR
jgi:hypothetical protein